jgi:glycosyltransferase involved in cell wall biosynthesis
VIGLVGDRAGFQQAGGIRTLVQLLLQRLDLEGISHRILTATQHATAGCNAILVVGCSSPWAYGLALKTRLQRPGVPIHWIPCFHPPQFVRHRLKAHLALWALRRLQQLGIQVHTLTQAEHAALNNGRCTLLSLPFDCEKTFAEAKTKHGRSITQRPYALAFLGRPVAQKGWTQYLNIVQRLGENCLALVPSQPTGPCPENLNIQVGLSDADVCEGLRQSQILILPSDYESFGFAQAEALLSGCCVPVLGEWPLWLDVPALDWRLLTTSQIAQRAHALLTQPATLQSLQTQQRQAWMQRPERSAPRLPRLHG